VSVNLDGFTKTQLRILKVLADGKPHQRKELEACLCGPKRSNLKPHLAAMRKLLRPQGQNILCVVHHRRFEYCWVQLCPFAYQALFRNNGATASTKG